MRGRDPGLRWLRRKAGEIHCTYMDSPFRERDGWKDGETSYVRVNVWHDLAEHVVDSLSKGDQGLGMVPVCPVDDVGLSRPGWR